MDATRAKLGGILSPPGMVHDGVMVVDYHHCGEALPEVDRRIEMEAGLDELMLVFQDRFTTYLVDMMV